MHNWGKYIYKCWRHFRIKVWKYERFSSRIEVVLADGRIMNNLKRLRKDNSGYAIKHMFMGAEGTLGVITAACLRLFPKIENKVTAFASLSNLDATIQLLETLKVFLVNYYPHMNSFQKLDSILRLNMEMN